MCTNLQDGHFRIGKMHREQTPGLKTCALLVIGFFVLFSNGGIFAFENVHCEQNSSCLRVTATVICLLSGRMCFYFLLTVCLDGCIFCFRRKSLVPSPNSVRVFSMVLQVVIDSIIFYLYRSLAELYGRFCCLLEHYVLLLLLVLANHLLINVVHILWLHRVA